MQTHDLKLRLPANLKSRLQREADTNNRSMNGELVQILKQHFGMNEPRKKLVFKRGAA